MAKVKITGHASGTGIFTVTAPNSSTDRTITLPDNTGALLTSSDDLPAANLTGTVASARITASSIANDLIDSQHYAAGSIDNEHIADDAINSEHYAAASIDNEHLADDAVGVAELSATGTASSSTFLRGDNSWTAVSTPITALNNATANELVTVGSTTTELDAESGLTYDGSTLAVTGDLSASGDIYAAVGSEANPSFAFTGDTNTGLWHPDADTIAFSTGGSEEMRLLSDGTLCVGETSVMSSLGTSLFSRANKANGYSAIFLNDGNDANRWGILIACGMDTPSSTVNYPIKFRDGDGNDIDNISYDSTGMSYNGQNTAKCWVSFMSDTGPSFRDSHNCSSITDHGVGELSINMTNAMSDATSWAVVANCGANATNPSVKFVASVPVDSDTFRLEITRGYDGAASDMDFISAVVFGD